VNDEDDVSLLDPLDPNLEEYVLRWQLQLEEAGYMLQPSLSFFDATGMVSLLSSLQKIIENVRRNDPTAFGIVFWANDP
jgi:hypothetical protein